MNNNQELILNLLIMHFYKDYYLYSPKEVITRWEYNDRVGTTTHKIIKDLILGE